MKPSLLKNRVAQYLTVLLGSALYAAGLNWFVLPLGLYSGGVVGFAQLLSGALESLLARVAGGANLYGAVYLAINLPLLLLAWTKMGRGFLLKTLVGTLGISFFMLVIPQPAQPLIPDPTAAVLLGGILSGFGIGVVLTAGGSGGGLDIVGVWAAQRFAGFSVGKLTVCVNAVLFAIYLVLFDISTVIYSLIYMAFYIIVLDRTHYQNINVRMMIFTKQRGIDKSILQKTARGVTEWTGLGAYTGEDTNVLVTIISKFEVDAFLELVHAMDPSAFVIIDENVRVSGNFEKRL